MSVLNSLSEWLSSGNEPETASDANDLENALSGKSAGQYRSSMKTRDLRLVTGSGQFGLLFHLSTVEAKVAELRSTYLSEPGADWHGDEIAQKGMERND
jgi:hypothetical protein